jgi:hypothetical protein
MNNPFASRWLPFGCLVLLSFVLARGSATSESGEDEAACPREETSGFARLRAATGTVRPPGDHGCKPVEIVPGLWTAHFHDIDSPEKLRSSNAWCSHDERMKLITDAVSSFAGLGAPPFVYRGQTSDSIAREHHTGARHQA